MLCACSNVNNTVERCEAQQEATLERDKQSLKRVRGASAYIFCAAIDKLLELVHCALLRLLFNVKAKGTIGVHAETVACTCMPRPWMLGIDERHCDTLLAASCVRVVIKIIVKKRGNKKSIIVPGNV